MGKVVEIYEEHASAGGSDENHVINLPPSGTLVHLSVITTTDPPVPGTVEAHAVLSDGRVTGRVLDGGVIATPRTGPFLLWQGIARYDRLRRLFVNVVNNGDSSTSLNVAISAVVEVA